MMLSHLLHDCQNVKGLLNFAPKRIKLVYKINSFAPEPPLTTGVDPHPFYIPLMMSSVLQVKDNFVH